MNSEIELSNINHYKLSMGIGNPHYPVNALMGNVLYTFMKLNHEFDFQITIEKGLDKKIVMELTDKPITDVAELSAKNQIKLYDNFSSFTGVCAIALS